MTTRPTPAQREMFDRDGAVEAGSNHEGRVLYRIVMDHHFVNHGLGVGCANLIPDPERDWVPCGMPRGAHSQ